MDDLDRQMHKALDGQRYDDFERLATQAQNDLDATLARLSAADALLSAALWYASQDIPVFPVTAAGKQPLLSAAHAATDPLRTTCRGECARQGHGLYDATTDRTTITNWWTRAPQANIGLPTGALFDVIDIDGHTGAISYRTMLAEDMVPTVYGRVTTGRDCGRHLYVKATGDGNGTRIMPGIDYRGAGGYVVAPPSVIAPGGKDYPGVYRWIRPLTLPTGGAA